VVLLLLSKSASSLSKTLLQPVLTEGRSKFGGACSMRSCSSTSSVAPPGASRKLTVKSVPSVRPGSGPTKAKSRTMRSSSTRSRITLSNASRSPSGESISTTWRPPTCASTEAVETTNSPGHIQRVSSSGSRKAR